MSMREYFEQVHSAMEAFWEGLVRFAATVSEAAILLALYLTWPLWAIPYAIIRYRKEKDHGK